MPNYPAAFYSSSGPTQAALGAGRGAAADGPHALRAGESVAGLHYVVVGNYRKVVTLPRLSSGIRRTVYIYSYINGWN